MTYPEHTAIISTATWFRVINLIPYNPIREADYKRPNSVRIRACQSLKQQQIAVSVRYSAAWKRMRQLVNFRP